MSVEVFGLRAGGQFNGRRGTVVIPKAPLKSGRVAVLIDGETKPKSLKRTNLREV